MGRGKGVAPYASGSQWKAKRNAETRAVPSDQPRLRASRKRIQMPMVEETIVGIDAARVSQRGPSRPARRKHFAQAPARTRAWKS